MQQPIVEMLVWMRVPGDTIFSVGAVALAWFVFRLWVAPRRAAAGRPRPLIAESGVAAAAVVRPARTLCRHRSMQRLAMIWIKADARPYRT